MVSCSDLKMSEHLSIQEVGGELVEHYPDRGMLPDSHWYNAVLRVKTEDKGLRAWLKRIERAAFFAVLSANGDGLRVVVSLYRFAIFIPWHAVVLSASRGWPATVARLRTAALPSLTLVFDLDDAAADDLFRNIAPALPHREPPRSLYWLQAPAWAVYLALGLGLIVALAAALVVREACLR
jgi:hypothetical protein